MDRTPQDIVLTAQLYLYNLAEQLDDADRGEVSQLADEAHNLGVELEQVMAAFPGTAPATLMQTVTLTLQLVLAEATMAEQATRDTRARMQDGVKALQAVTCAEDKAYRQRQVDANSALYHEAMAYHAQAGGAVQVLRRLQRRLRLETQTGRCIGCGCTEADCSQCIEAQGEPCAWANETKTLCTRCAHVLNAPASELKKCECALEDIVCVQPSTCATCGGRVEAVKTISDQVEVAPK